MSVLDFPAVLSLIADYSTAVTHNQIYINIFNSYLVESRKLFSVEEYTVSKIKSGKKSVEKECRLYYNDPENRNIMSKDIRELILPNISDKFGSCSAVRDLIISDSMDDKDRELLLSKYPKTENEISSFIADVVIFSLNRPNKPDARSPLMSERINIPAISCCKYFCGRKKELQTLSEMLEAHDKIFISGIGGIGKSEFVKKFIKDKKSKFTNILFLTFSENLKNTIAYINFKGDRSDETIENLYSRHLDYLRTMGSDTLIIIDNFDIFPDDDLNFNDILELSCKIIFTTRTHLENDFDVLEIRNIDIDSFFEMAEQLEVKYADKEVLREIFSALHEHTLACELILRLMKKSTYSADELLKKIRTEHVSLDISDKIRKEKSATYYEHIHQLFRLFALTDEQKNVMRLLSLIPVSGITDRYFMQLTDLKNMNEVNELNEIGLVNYEDHLITVHPLISEAAAADFSPDMDNIKNFLDTLIGEFQYHLYSERNIMRQAVILEISDRIVEFAKKNDIERYFYFLVNACPYAETFEDKDRMLLYISEMEKHFDNISDDLSKAVYFMSKAAYAMLFENSSASAIKYTRKAMKLVPDVLEFKRDYSKREVALCFNIYNNLGNFYMSNHEPYNAKKYIDLAKQVCETYKIPIFEFPALVDNLRKISTR